jgi:hypothetical protein
LQTATFNAPVPIHPEGLAFFPPFLEGHGAFVCDQDLSLTVRIRDLDSGLHVADAVTDSEAPLAAARDVDDAAPQALVTAEGRLAATWAENPDAALASLSSERLWSGYVMPLALVSGIKEAEPHLVRVKQLPYSGIVKDLDFTSRLLAIHHPTALQERWSPVCAPTDAMWL